MINLVYVCEDGVVIILFDYNGEILLYLVISMMG